MEISIPGYNVFRQDRSSRAGGTVMYVKDHINCTVVLSKSVPKKFELLVLKLQLSLYVSVRFDFTNERFIVLCSLKLCAGYHVSPSLLLSATENLMPQLTH